MSQIIIDEEKCIGCSLCVDDCPGSTLYLEGGTAHAYENGCIECGHCYAICPQNAVTMANYECKDEPVVSMTEIDPDTLLAAMRSRRTIRHFKDQPVEEEKIAKILEAGRYAPTGSNSQGITYTILTDKKAQVEEMCVGMFRAGKESGSPAFAYLGRMNITDDFFFKGAPLVIVVSGNNTVNASLASAYMEIMANSLGLGVLYSGFLVACAKKSRELKNLLEIPDGDTVMTCLIMGYPAVEYQRIVPRKPLQKKEI